MYKRSGIWWTCISHNGRKFQKSLETSDKKLAKTIEAKIRTEIVEGSYFDNLAGRNKNFKDLMNRFITEYAPTLSENTQRSYTTSLKFLMPFFKDSNLISITPKMISRYKVFRKSDGVKPATINRELAVLSKAFNLAVKEWEWAKDNPTSKVSRERENNARDRWLTIDEERRLLDNSPEWIEQIIIFSLNTGLRLGELSNLEWSRVNIFNKTIHINITKNGEQKTLPLNKIALDVLEKKFIVKSLKNDYVFKNSIGGKVNHNSLRNLFHKSLRKAKIDNFRLHDLRHTFATRLAQKGIDIYKISKLLGHKDIKMTQRYAHHCPDSLRNGVEILETYYNLTTIEEKQKSESL
jgi:integrase